MMNYEIPGLPSYGPIAHLVGRWRPKYKTTKMSSEDIDAIEFDYSTGMTQTSIAKKYGVSRSTVSSIINGKF